MKIWTFLIHPLEHLIFFRSQSFDVPELSRNTGIIRNFIRAFLPSIAEAVMFVARKK